MLLVIVYSSSVFRTLCDSSHLTFDPVLTLYRPGGGRGGSSARPGHPESQRQQRQPQWLPRGPGALYCAAHTPGASPSGERTHKNKHDLSFINTGFVEWVGVLLKNVLRERQSVNWKAQSSHSIQGIQCGFIILGFYVMSLTVIEHFIYATND